ncbi:MAG: FAD-dependent oxidoreductase, partial [Myxococcales bacterium]|nr:FAD-dependent oxidoreductase [Myxococcales bacterium]
EAESVVFETSCDPLADGPEDLLARFHAIVLATGARVPRDIDVPARELAGVAFAMDYLERHNRLVAGEADRDPALDAAGKRVVVLGGGDTGSDCIGTAHRQGAREVINIELFEEPPQRRAANNPWPQWPLVLRSSSSHEEGGERRFGLRTLRLEGDDGKLRRLVAERVRLEAGVLVATGEPEVVVEADLLVLALGFVGPDVSALAEQEGVELDARGNVRAEGFVTNTPGIYAAGDARRGQSLVVWALSEGREAARAIDRDLRGAPSPLPTRGRDEPFGGR